MLKEKDKDKIVLTGKFESSKTNLRHVNINLEQRPVIELIKKICKRRVKQS
jgi:hypothetical protein